jgi:hypothetical protein
MLNKDYKDMLRALSDEKVKFLLVGPMPWRFMGIPGHLPSLADLIRNKRASGRTKDLADAEALESLQRSG